MKHKDKVKLATKMNNGQRKGMFLSDAWEKRKQAIAKRVAKKIMRVKSYKLKKE